MAVLQTITRIIDQISEKSGRAVAWLTLVIILLGAWNALARYLARYIGVDLSSNSLLELQWYLFSVIFLVGGAYVLKHNAHVRVDVLYDHFPEKVRCWVNLIGHLLLLIPFCVFMVWISIEPVHESWRIKEMSNDPGGLPRYPIKTVIPIAFILLGLHGINEVLKCIISLVTGTCDEVKEEKGGEA